MVIKAEQKSVLIELQYYILEQLLNASMQKNSCGETIMSILNSQAGKMGYYSAIFAKLQEFCTNIKKQMVKEYFKGAYKLKEDNIKPFVFIIEEIDNCNISEIFGDALFLINEEHRSECAMNLIYSKEKFIIPKNVYILGTITMPNYMSDLKNWDLITRKFYIRQIKPHHELVADFGCDFSKKFKVLNDRITALLDETHQIGHGYFMAEKYANSDIDTLKDLWFRYIQPRLRFYFKYDFEKLQTLLGTAKTDDSSFIKLDKTIQKYSWASQDNVKFDFEAALENAFG